MKNTAFTLLSLAILSASTFSVMLVQPVFGATTSYSVSVGYADNLRPSPAFPSPWCGDSGVALFAGLGTPCAGGTTAFDSGAFMITNTGTTSITITAVSVNLHPAVGSPTYSLWSSFLPFTLPAGDHAIFAQTANSEDFDSSDSPLGLTTTNTLSNNCSTGPQSTSSLCTTNAPQITITTTELGTQMFNDASHTLDTGGQDAVSYSPCPQGDINGQYPGNCNESLQWRDISSSCGTSCAFGTGVPEFGLPAVFVAGVGLLAIVFMRRTVLSPRRVTAQSSRPNTWQV